MSAHTPEDHGEPWSIESRADGSLVKDRNEALCLLVTHASEEELPRSVACVNACAGLEDPAEALRDVKTILGMIAGGIKGQVFFQNGTPCDVTMNRQDMQDAAREALALLTPKT